MKAADSYIAALAETTNVFVETQQKPMQLLAQKIADSYRSGGMFYVLGTGHSHMVAEEFFYRAGGLARVTPILEEGLMLHNGAVKSSALERLSGYAQVILERYPVGSNDVVLVISNSGRNAVPIEAALEAQRRGAFVAALTSLQHSSAAQARHSCGKRLFEVADLVIDNCGVYGDAAVAVASVGGMGATSSVIGCIAAQLIGVMTAEAMVQQGQTPEVFISANSDEGDKHNAALLQKYSSVVKCL